MRSLCASESDGGAQSGGSSVLNVGSCVIENQEAFRVDLYYFAVYNADQLCPLPAFLSRNP